MITSLIRLSAAFGIGAACLAAGAPVAGATGDLIGEQRIHRTVHEDTLLAVARQYGLGFIEMLAANPGIDPWLPGAGTSVVLPTAHLLPDAARDGIVINLATQRLYYFGGRTDAVLTFPIGIGRLGRETPLGATYVAGKRERPTWIPPASIRTEHPDLPAAVPPGPANPLGMFALDLGWSGYVIHGTNKPYGIGRRVSHGCIRLYPEHIARLFERVETGTPVTIVDQPVKLGWSGGALYLEVHPTQAQGDELEAQGRFRPRPISDIVARVKSVTGVETDRVDWAGVSRVARERRGIPVRITY